jgi:hypothetical protein
MASAKGAPNGEDPEGVLLSEDHSEIKLVPAADRDWWAKLSTGARARFAERHRKKWTDEETIRLITADPDAVDYFELGAEMGRGPGALRTRRSQMIHLIKEEYDYVAKAQAYLEDPKTHHKYADIGQVYRLLHELGVFELPVHQQFELARHLKQPSPSWRGDNTTAVEREQRTTLRFLQNRMKKQRTGAEGSEE